MSTRNINIAAALLFGAASMLASATGCELVASVDRSLIGGGTGGSTSSTTTTTSAGGGGSTTSTGGGGTGGEMPMCMDPATDCPATGSECIKAICNADKTCGTENVAQDTPLADQTAGDCKTAVCDGNGGVGSKNDDNDVKDDSNPCTADSCNAGAEVHAPESAGKACTLGADPKAKVCDGASTCVECNTATQATDCASKVCQANMCVSAQCNDTVKNGDETDTDCGGSCGPCADGKVCSAWPTTAPAASAPATCARPRSAPTWC
jgi:hypothetical protein